jgi:hypothetical protein
MIEPISRGVLDTPLEPVIGLAEGETRWRGTTTASGASRSRTLNPEEATKRPSLRARPLAGPQPSWGDVGTPVPPPITVRPACISGSQIPLW